MQFVIVYHRLLIPLVLIGLSLYLILAIITEKGQLQSCLGLVVFFVIPLISSKYPDDVRLFIVMAFLIVVYLYDILST